MFGQIILSRDVKNLFLCTLMYHLEDVKNLQWRQMASRHLLIEGSPPSFREGPNADSQPEYAWEAM